MVEGEVKAIKQVNFKPSQTAGGKLQKTVQDQISSGVSCFSETHLYIRERQCPKWGRLHLTQ